MPEKTSVQEPRFFSYGGGVQSTAALVLAVQGRIDYRTFLFCNVGHDSENPLTLEYVNNVAIPYAKDNGIELQVLSLPHTIYEHTVDPDKSIPIPIRFSTGTFGVRECTTKWKRDLVARYVRKHMKGHKQATVGIGISFDELHRMSDSRVKYLINDYPLAYKKITRDDCKKIIADAGLPVPVLSACYFCPFKSRKQWLILQEEQPELFQKCIELEEIIQEKRKEKGLDPEVFLYNGVSLKELEEDFEYYEFEPTCDTGYCFI